MAIAEGSSRDVVAQVPPGAIVAQNGISWGGLLVDSFDSSDASYSTNGQYDPAKPKANGDIYSFPGGIVAGTSHVYGHVYAGQATWFNVAGSGMVGDLTWNSKGIQPGHRLSFPKPFLPSPPLPYTEAPIPLPGLFTTPSYTNAVDHLLLGGHYKVDASALSIGVMAPSTLYAPNGLSANIYVAPGAHLTVYVDCYFSQWGPGAMGRACDLVVYGLSSATNVTLSGQFCGVIYAPTATLELGSSTLAGTAIVNTARAYGSAHIHYDEQLNSIHFGPPSISAPQLQPDGTFKLSVDGFQDLDHVLEASPDLQAWTPVQTNTCPFTYNDYDAPNCGGRFYRVRTFSP